MKYFFYLLSAALIFIGGCQTDVVPQIPFCTDLDGNAFPDATLEVYAPTQSGTYPALVFFPGRSQNILSGTNTAILQEAVARGFVAIDVNYSMPSNVLALTPGDPYVGNPMMFGAQARCAIRHLRAHAAEYKIDPDKIGVIGHSQGSFVASYLAFISDNRWEELLDEAQPMITQLQAKTTLDYPYSTVDSYTNVFAAENINSGFPSEVNGIAILSGASDALNVSSSCIFINPALATHLQPQQNPGTTTNPCTPWNSSITTISSTNSTSSLRLAQAWKLIGMTLTQVTVNSNGNYVEVPGSLTGQRVLNIDAVNLMNLMSPIAGIADENYKPAMLLEHSVGDAQAHLRNALITGRVLDNLGRVAKSVVLDGNYHNMHLDATVGPTARELYYGFFKTVLSSSFVNTEQSFEQTFNNFPEYSSFSGSHNFFCTASAAPLNSARTCDVQ